VRLNWTGSGERHPWDLDSLRDREDFKQLLADLEAKPDK
jgi:hypothetical protein